MRGWGLSIEAKTLCRWLVQVWMSVGEYRDCKSKRMICKKPRIRDSDEKIYEVCTLNNDQKRIGKA